MRTRDKAINELAANAELFYRAATDRSESQISERPAEDKWSVKEILCHLADIQEVGLGRIKKMLAEDDPAIELYDEEKENKERDHSRADMQKHLAAFLLGRAHLLAAVSDRGDNVWQRSGRHPLRNKFTVEFVVNDMLDHERLHFEQIDQWKKPVK